ncbi:MAG: RecQ family ATP-dependent DNA helicase [Kiritimatiellae bacterium]|nr:RecQ family ATP-dependent DNA helicase [Kiritimatiellia bacterium]
MKSVLRYTASARLSAWSAVLEHDTEFAELLDAFLREHGHATLEADAPSGSRQDADVTALAAVLDKVVIRGHPTLVDFEFESGLLVSLAKSKLLTVADPETPLTIERRITGKAFAAHWGHLIHAAAELSQLPLAAPEAGPHAVVLEGGDGDGACEETLSHLVKLLRHHVGAGPEHLWTNVQVGDLVGERRQSPQTAVARQQQVQLAVHRGKVKWAIRLGRASPEDGAADAVLKGEGWNVFQLPRESIRAGLAEWLAERRREWTAQPQLQWPTISEAAAGSGMHVAAYLSVVIPQAVHRCLRGWIAMLLEGLIVPGRPQRVLLIEEDVPAAVEALRQLWVMWSHLHELAPSTPPPPSLEVDLIGSMFSLSLPDAIKLRQVPAPTGTYDLVLSHSFRLATGWASETERAAQLSPTGQRARLRRAVGSREARALRVADPLRYELEDVESAATSDNPSLDEVTTKKTSALRYFLRQLFRKRDFWDGQLRVISRLLQRKHTVVLLPTGGGKSLTYQFSGLLLPGMTLVVDPLVALINDQLENLQSFAIDMIGSISSQTDQVERERSLSDLAEGRLMFLFVAPERLQMRDFRAQLQRAVTRCPVSLVTIDEAHCVSEWGHDFRPSYLHMPLNVQRFCAGPDNRPPTLVGLTGTASFAVLTDVQAELGITDERAVVVPRSFDRKELVFEVKKVRRRDKLQALLQVRRALPQTLGESPETFFELRGRQTNSGIVFCPHVNGPLGVKEVAQRLGHTAIFAGEMPRGFVGDIATWNRHKLAVQHAFKHNRIQELVATKSFGMGIDKPNIRYTIHYAMPQSVEGFYQEAGRAGRNGQHGYARCIVLYSDDNWETGVQILSERDHTKANFRLETVDWDYRGDLMVQLWLLLNSYKGREQETANAVQMWRFLHASVAGLPVGAINLARVPFGAMGSRDATEKAIFRLVLLGAVEDYTVDWPQQIFEVSVRHAGVETVRQHLAQYIGKYKFPQHVETLLANVPSGPLSAAIETAARVLVDFIYDEIVERRKQALRTMGELCRNFRSDAEFREAILAYLQESEFTEPLKKWLRRPFAEIGLREVTEMLQSAQTLDQIKRMLGTVRRLLDEEPDNLALRLISVCARAICPTETDEGILEEAMLLFGHMQQEGQISRRAAAKAWMFVFNHLVEHRPQAATATAERLLRTTGDRWLAGLLLATPVGAQGPVRKFALGLLAAAILKPVLACGFWRTAGTN